MNGLRGRMFFMPAQKNASKKEFLLIYGHHSSIERMAGYVEILSRYGNVTVPDLPGFGGMESFYKIGEKPTIENYADYLAAFVKLRFKRKKVIIVGMSFAVPIYVKMLQKYPALSKKVEYCVSLVGFVHYEDFYLRKNYIMFVKMLAKATSNRLVSYIFTKIILRERLIKFLYKLIANRHGKLLGTKQNDRKSRISMETNLWMTNDFRTRMFTILEMLRVDLCNTKVKNHIHHVSTETDIYFNQEIVAQHMQIIFNKFTTHMSPFKAHAPSVAATSKEIEAIIPKSLIKVIKS